MDTNSGNQSGKTEGQDPNAQLGFEGALEKLQQTVKKLESGELTLEQSLQQFEEGVRLTRICQQYLATAEQRVEVLMKSSTEGQFQLGPYSNPRQ